MLKLSNSAIAMLVVVTSITCRHQVIDAPLIATPGSGLITPIGTMSTARSAHTATLLTNGKVLVTGGFASATYATAEIYDSNSKSFRPAGTMNDARASHSSTLLPDGKLLLAGGYNGAYLATAEIYDPATGNFMPAGRMTTPRSGHVAILLYNGKVLFAGGVGTGWTFLSSAELYDPVTDTFAPTGDMTTTRESHTVTMLKNGKILITGGHRGRQSAITIYASAEIYDPAAGTFSTTGNMTTRRHKHDAVPLPDGRVLINGGSDERDDRGAYASAEIYNPETGTFNAIGEMPTIRYKHQGTSILLPSGKALLAGGASNAVLYDPANNTFSVVAGLLGTSRLSRLFSTATLLSTGEVLITGGYGLGQNTSANAWIYEL
ncbi:MAG: Kelch repeat-containing protein [bacterium]